MRENIKLGLLGVITITLIYHVFIQTESVTKHEDAKEAIVSASTTPPTATPSNIAQEPQAPDMPKTNVTFAKMEHDFGKVKQETQNKYTFKFTNTGTEPLLISNARGSCGCTVPTYPKEPVAPGATGEIVVEYSPGKQQGSQTKTVTITANTEPTETVLKISAQVEEI